MLLISKSHDNMAGFIHSKTRRFFDIYEDQVDIIQRKMVEYIKILQPSAMEKSDLSRSDLIISTKEGYPWLPSADDEIEQKKEELEKLLRSYLNDQYSKCQIIK